MQKKCVNDLALSGGPRPFDTSLSTSNLSLKADIEKFLDRPGMFFQRKTPLNRSERNLAPYVSPRQSVIQVLVICLQPMQTKCWGCYIESS
jgi:hypothetical protein